jgi:hypothetical protein
MHYERLHLVERYNEAGATAIVEIQRTLEQGRLRNRSQAGARLRDEANALRDLYGANHWKAVLLTELATCNTFLESVLEQNL